MKTSWIRFSLVAFVLVVLVNGASALARPTPFSIVKCSKYTCTSPGVCQTPYIGNGYCTQGKNGPGFPSDIACCCCSGADISNRWFHGE
jgi:hypothetical protein